VNFVVLPAHQVTLTVSRYSTALQDHFKRIIHLLEEDPYPSRPFGDIEAFRDSRGRDFYQFFDGIIPVVFQYRVYTPDVYLYKGLVWVSLAIPVEMP